MPQIAAIAHWPSAAASAGLLIGQWTPESRVLKNKNKNKFKFKGDEGLREKIRQLMCPKDIMSYSRFTVVCRLNVRISLVKKIVEV